MLLQYILFIFIILLQIIPLQSMDYANKFCDIIVPTTITVDWNVPLATKKVPLPKYFCLITANFPAKITLNPLFSSSHIVITGPEHIVNNITFSPFFSSLDFGYQKSNFYFSGTKKYIAKITIGYKNQELLCKRSKQQLSLCGKGRYILNGIHRPFLNLRVEDSAHVCIKRSIITQHCQIVARNNTHVTMSHSECSILDINGQDQSFFTLSTTKKNALIKVYLANKSYAELSGETALCLIKTCDNTVCEASNLMSDKVVLEGAGNSQISCNITNTSSIKTSNNSKIYCNIVTPSKSESFKGDRTIMYIPK